MNMQNSIHTIVVLKPVKVDSEIIIEPKAHINLDTITEDVVKSLRDAWRKDPLTLGGDIIYLFNQNLPRPIPEEDLEVGSKL